MAQGSFSVVFYFFQFEVSAVLSLIVFKVIWLKLVLYPHMVELEREDIIMWHVHAMNAYITFEPKCPGDLGVL